jgi:hypothetical protein
MRASPGTSLGIQIPSSQLFDCGAPTIIKSCFLGVRKLKSDMRRVEA